MIDPMSWIKFNTMLKNNDINKNNTPKKSIKASICVLLSRRPYSHSQGIQNESYFSILAL